MKVPAATAVPITPATFGPIACISRKLVGSASAPTFWDTRAAIGTADTPAEPISGLILPPDKLAHQLTKQNAACGTERECNQTQSNDLQMYLIFRNASALVVAPTEVPSRITTMYISALEAVSVSCLYHAALTEQVTKHQHTNQRSCGRQKQADNDGNNNREQDLLQLGNRTKLLHLDLPLFLQWSAAS